MSSAAPGQMTPEAFFSALASEVAKKAGQFSPGSPERELAEQSSRGLSAAAGTARAGGAQALKEFLTQPDRYERSGLTQRMATNLALHLDDFAAGRQDAHEYLGRFSSAFDGDLAERRAAAQAAAHAAAAARAPSAPPVPPAQRPTTPAEFFRALADEKAAHVANMPDGAEKRTALRSQATLAHLADLAHGDDKEGRNVRNFLSDPKARAGLDVDEALLAKLRPHYKNFLAGHVTIDKMADIAHEAMDSAHISAGAAARNTTGAAHTAGAAPSLAGAPTTAPAPAPAHSAAGSHKSGVTSQWNKATLAKRGLWGSAILATGALLTAGAVYLPDIIKDKLPGSSAPTIRDATSVNSSNGASFDGKAQETKGRQFSDALLVQLRPALASPQALADLKITAAQASLITTKLAAQDNKAKVVDAVDGGLDSVTVRLPAGDAVKDKPVALKISRDKIEVQVGSGADKTTHEIATSAYARSAYDGKPVVQKKTPASPAPG